MRLAGLIRTVYITGVEPPGGLVAELDRLDAEICSKF